MSRRRQVDDVSILAALHVASEHHGALERRSGSWTGRVGADVIAELLRRDLVEPVEHDRYGDCRRIELNLRGQDLIADAHQLASQCADGAAA